MIGDQYIFVNIGRYSDEKQFLVETCIVQIMLIAHLEMDSEQTNKTTIKSTRFYVLPVFCVHYTCASDTKWFDGHHVCA